MRVRTLTAGLVPLALVEGWQVSPSFSEIYCTTLNTVAAGVKGVLPFIYGASFGSLDLGAELEADVSL